MESLNSERENEGRIVLFVSVPDCPHCRKRIEDAIMRSGFWERVEIGYPNREGTSVSMIYHKGKYRDVDYWKLAEDIKVRLEELCYRVL